MFESDVAVADTSKTAYTSSLYVVHGIALNLAMFTPTFRMTHARHCCFCCDFCSHFLPVPGISNVRSATIPSGSPAHRCPRSPGRTAGIGSHSCGCHASRSTRLRRYGTESSWRLLVLDCVRQALEQSVVGGQPAGPGGRRRRCRSAR